MEKLTVLYPGLINANSRHQDLKHLFETLANNIQAFFLILRIRIWVSVVPYNLKTNFSYFIMRGDRFISNFLHSQVTAAC